MRFDFSFKQISPLIKWMLYYIDINNKVLDAFRFFF